MDSYLRNREVVVRWAGECWQKRTTRGCVQGSVVGSTLWNLILDPLLAALETGKIYHQVFADDIVLAFSGDYIDKLETIANETLGRVHRWGVLNKLKFAPHKTQSPINHKKSYG